ncbi:hypothetical protein TNCV_336821 [Trichonephila clavipes]|nr:hypothetical protein TNCV_336821 [Trichonephila clavipes]
MPDRKFTPSGDKPFENGMNSLRFFASLFYGWAKVNFASRNNPRNKRWAGQILLEKTVADEVRSLMKELPCKLQYDWSRPINAESGRGNRLGRSGNKRPGTRRS